MEKVFSIYRDIDQGWELVPLSYIAREIKNKNLGMKESNLLSLSYGRIVRRRIDSNEGLLPESFEGYNKIQQGDVVLRLTDLQNDKKSLRVGICEEAGIITSAYTTLRSQNIDPRWLYYSLHAYDVQKIFYALGSGLRQSMGYEDLKNLPIALPPVSLQTKIADYLDNKVSEINTLVKLRTEQIQLMLEVRENIIEETLFPEGLITRPRETNDCTDLPNGFSQNIPNGWQKRKFRFVARKMSTASGGTGELLSVYLGEGIIPFSQGGEDRVHNPSEDMSKYQIVRPGDLVMNNQQAWRGSVGISALHGIVSPAYHVYEISNELEPIFANYLFRSRPMVFQYEQVSRGVGSIQRNLDGSTLMSIEVVYPDKGTQLNSAKKIETRLQEINEAIETSKDSIREYRELKNSLIAEVVSSQLNPIEKIGAVT